MSPSVGLLSLTAIRPIATVCQPRDSRGHDGSGRPVPRLVSTERPLVGFASRRYSGVPFVMDMPSYAADSTSVLMVRPAVVALQQRNVDAGPLLRDASISRAELASADGRMPFHRVRDLWESAAEAARDVSFGVHVAEALPFGALDILDYILAAAPSGDHSFRLLVRYARVLRESSSLRLTVGAGDVRLVLPSPTLAPQYDEFWASLLVLRSRAATGIDWMPERVAFSHERRRDDGELARVLGTVPRFGAVAVDLRIPAAVLSAPHRRADPVLLGVLCRFADAMLARAPAKGTFVTLVSSVISRQMEEQLPTLQSTAHALGLEPRTVQRRLAGECASFSDLLDASRRELAERYLATSRASVAEVARHLHFSDATTFHRAFKRWTKEAPSGYRRRSLVGPGS